MFSSVETSFAIWCIDRFGGGEMGLDLRKSGLGWSRVTPPKDGQRELIALR